MITNYTELKTAIQNWLDNDNPNLVAEIPTFIQLLESEASRELQTWELECKSTHPIVPTGTVDADRGVYDLPVDWEGARYILRRADLIEMLYGQRIAALSDSNVTNWMLDKHPDFYLFGSLAMAESWLKNDPRIPQWAAAAEVAKKQIQIANQSQRYSGDQLKMRMDDDRFWRGARSGEGRLKYLTPSDFSDLKVSGASNRSPARHSGWYTTSAGKLRIWPVPNNDPADAAGWSACA